MPLTRRHLLAAAGTALAARARAASAPKSPPSPIFGAAFPLSGEFSLVGDECLRGIQLAADATNAAGGIGGKPVALASADSMSQATAGDAVNTLINTSHANILFGSGASLLSYPASAAAELAQLPFIELDAMADGIITRGFKFLLRTAPTTTMVGALAAATIQKHYAKAKLGLLFNTGANAGAIAAAAISALDAAKIPILLAQGYPADVTDLYDPVGRLKRAGAELILHAADPTDVLAFFAATEEQSWRPVALIGCGDGYLLRETAAAIGPAFENTLVIGAPCYLPATAPIAAAYLARYGTPPRSADSLTAYAGAKLTFDTLNSVNADPTKLLDAMRKIDLPAGALANGFGAAFDHSGQNIRAFVTLQQWKRQMLTAVS